MVLQSGADSAGVAAALRDFKGGRIRHTYERGMKGFAFESSDADAQALARDVRVQFVEEDSVVTAASVPWGLDRVDQRLLPLDDSYSSNGSGAGVTVYVVDTGIFAGHDDFGGRVSPGFSAFSDSVGTADCNGHGTHVAGVIGGASYGVARAATLVPVRVLDCNGAGSISSVLSGLDWILHDHAQTPGPAVVNMSLGGEPSSSLDNEVNLLLASGLTAVVAAGNNNIDACRVSPARVPGAITVGASTEADQRATFSNYGACVDLFAPGTNILSDWYASPTATAVSTGTSAAAPFAAGTAALFLEKYPDATPGTVAQTLITQATPDVLGSVDLLTPNRLLFSLIDSSSDGTTAAAQLLADPGFDNGTTFWTTDICTVIKTTGCPPTIEEAQNLPSRSQTSHASLGGPSKSGRLLSEAVTIPSTATSAQLTFYLWVVSKGNAKVASDMLRVEIRDAAGNLLETLGTFSNLDASKTYVVKQFDVSRYRGATVRVAFTVAQNDGPPTWFLLDDVSLSARR